MIKVSAPAKIILSGEHSVVYGQPALLTAIDKRCFVSLKPRDDELIKIIDKKFKTQETSTFAKLRNFAHLTLKAWQSKDPLVLVKIAIDRLYGALERKPGKGFELVIDSQIPIASGLGSSAALAVAIVAGLLVFNHKKLDSSLINQIAFEIEKRQHGNPSGGDNSIVTFGSILRFQKINNQFKTNQLDFKKDLPVFLIQSGQPVESTGEMVALVREKSEKSNSKYKTLFRKMGKVTIQLIKELEKNNFNKLKSLKSLISENEKLLEELEVTGERAKKIISRVEKLGGAAKICGAGGIKKGSGIILALSYNQEKLKQFLQKEKIEFFQAKINQEGVRIEKS